VADRGIYRRGRGKGASGGCASSGRAGGRSLGGLEAKPPEAELKNAIDASRKAFWLCKMSSAPQ